MVTHAAFGGSTNLILHLAAVAHAAGLRRPNRDDWARVNAKVPRLVDVLPNGPRNHPTVQVFLAGGVPEVMLHLKRAGLAGTDALTASGETLGAMLDWWEKSERRARLRALLKERDGVDPDDVIMDPETARQRGHDLDGLFPHGQSGAGRFGDQEHGHRPERGGRRRRLPQDRPGARVLHRGGGHRGHQEHAARTGSSAGDVIVLAGRGPHGHRHGGDVPAHGRRCKYLEFGKHVALITDSRFSGVSTGACIGHVSPEALAGGPIGKVRDGDIDRDHHRPEPAGRLGQPDRRGRQALRRRGGRAGAGLAATASRTWPRTRGCRTTRACGPRCRT